MTINNNRDHSWGRYAMLTSECSLYSARATANARNTRWRRGGASSTAGPGPRPQCRATPTLSQPSPSALLHAARFQRSQRTGTKRVRWKLLCAGSDHRVRRRSLYCSAQGDVAGGSTEAAGRSCSHRYCEHLPAAWSFCWQHVEEIRQKGRGVG